MNSKFFRRFLFLSSTLISFINFIAQNNQEQIQLKVDQLIAKKAEYHRLTGGEKDGYRLKIFFGVDRDEAKRLREDSSAKSGKDKRNLYLANEGLLVDSKVSLKRHGDAQKSNNDMSDADREKRRRSQNEKKKK